MDQLKLTITLIALTFTVQAHGFSGHHAGEVDKMISQALLTAKNNVVRAPALSKNQAGTEKTNVVDSEQKDIEENNQAALTDQDKRSKAMEIHQNILNNARRAL